MRKLPLLLLAGAVLSCSPEESNEFVPTPIEQLWAHRVETDSTATTTIYGIGEGEEIGSTRVYYHEDQIASEVRKENGVRTITLRRGLGEDLFLDEDKISDLERCIFGEWDVPAEQFQHPPSNEDDYSCYISIGAEPGRGGVLGVSVANTRTWADGNYSRMSWSADARTILNGTPMTIMRTNRQITIEGQGYDIRSSGFVDMEKLDHYATIASRAHKE